MQKHLDTNAKRRCLYFAYGSNMSLRRLQKRVPSATKYCRARLNGYQLRFHKHSKTDGSAKCDAYMTGDSGDWVEGVVYEFDLSDKSKLDRVEGKGMGYGTKQIKVSNLHGQTFEAYTYIATDINVSLKPFDWYQQHVLTGARENHLPEAYIRRIAAIETITDDDKQRSVRELAIYS